MRISWKRGQCFQAWDHGLPAWVSSWSMCLENCLRRCPPNLGEACGAWFRRICWWLTSHHRGEYPQKPRREGPARGRRCCWLMSRCWLDAFRGKDRDGLPWVSQASQVDGTSISLKKSVRNLGVHLDEGLRAGTHCERVAAKLKTTASAIWRCAPRKWGLSYRTMKILYGGLIKPVASYAAAGWFDLTNERDRRKLQSAQRQACTSRYRESNSILHSAWRFTGRLLQDTSWPGLNTKLSTSFQGLLSWSRRIAVANLVEKQTDKRRTNVPDRDKRLALTAQGRNLHEVPAGYFAWEGCKILFYSCTLLLRLNRKRPNFLTKNFQHRPSLWNLISVHDISDADNLQQVRICLKLLFAYSWKSLQILHALREELIEVILLKHLLYWNVSTGIYLWARKLDQKR